jgi:hypothetical protein
MTTKRRSHVEHDWKDRSLKLMEQKKEMQERIDNLGNDLEETLAEQYSCRATIRSLTEEGIANARYNVKIGLLLLFSIATNVAFAVWAVWTVHNAQ